MSLVNNKVLGERIKTLRREQRITQRELSEKTNISVNSISEIERGNQAAYFWQMAEIASVLGVSLDVLLMSEEEFNARL